MRTEEKKVFSELMLEDKFIDKEEEEYRLKAIKAFETDGIKLKAIILLEKISTGEDCRLVVSTTKITSAYLEVKTSFGRVSMHEPVYNDHPLTMVGVIGNEIKVLEINIYKDHSLDGESPWKLMVSHNFDPTIMANLRKI